MTISAEEAARTPLVSDEQIEDRVSDLVGSAIRRKWWLFFLDGDDIQLPTIVPVDEAPLVPDAAATEYCMTVMSTIVEQLGATQVIIVWERPSGPTITMPDRVWARSIAEAAPAYGIRVRGQLISHRSGVRWFAPDDYAGELAAS